MRKPLPMLLRLIVLLLALSCALVAHAQPQQALRVVRTLGDPSEVVCVESEGAALWAGTLGAGVFRMEGGAQVRFDAARGLPGNRVRDCERYRGELWVATEAGLARFDAAAQRFERVLSGRYLRVAAFGETLIAARADGVVQRFERGRSAGEQRIFAVPSTLAIAASRWALGAVDGSLYVAEGGSAPRRVAIPEQPGAAAEPIEALAFDGEGLAIETASHALRVQAAAKVAVLEAAPRRDRFAPDPALQSVLVNDRVHTKGGGEAIATDAGLFVRARAGAPLEPVALDGLPCGDRISALAVQGDVLWIGSFDRGLCRLDARGMKHFRGPRYLPSDMVNALAASATELFVATAQGLTIVGQRRHVHALHARSSARASSPRAARGMPRSMASRSIRSAATPGSSTSARCIASTRGPGAWDHAPQGNKLDSRSLTRVAAFSGEVAIASSDRGLYLLRDDKLQPIDDQAGLADNWITDLAYDARGRLLARDLHARALDARRARSLPHVRRARRPRRRLRALGAGARGPHLRRHSARPERDRRRARDYPHDRRRPFGQRGARRGRVRRLDLGSHGWWPNLAGAVRRGSRVRPTT